MITGNEDKQRKKGTKTLKLNFEACYREYLCHKYAIWSSSSNVPIKSYLYSI